MSRSDKSRTAEAQSCADCKANAGRASGSEQKPVTVVVVGMHRSGTSMVGGVLSQLGIHMGDRLEGKAYHNPLGHYEDLDFAHLNDKLINDAGGSWDDPPPHAAIMEQNASDRIDAIVKAKSELGSWGWKDPRTSLTIEHYLPHLTDPKVIFCHRSANAVAASLKKRDAMPAEKATRLKKTYDGRVDEFLQAHPGIPRLDVTYEDVLENPESEVARIVDFLAIKPSKREVRSAVRFVKPRASLTLLKLKHAATVIVTKPHLVIKTLWNRLVWR